MKLHTGKEIPGELVAAYSLTLDRILKTGVTGVLALADLRAKAENPKHKIFDPEGEKLLKRHGLLERDGRMHDLARDFILAAVKIRKNGDIDIVNPRTGK